MSAVTDGETTVQRKKYGSEYERLVLTEPHPKPQYRPLEPPPYVTSTSRLGIWLEVRMEEIVVVALMLCVLAYCVAVYTGMYVSMFLPMRNMIGQAWDLAAFSIAFVKYAPVDRKLRKRAKKPLFAMTAVLAVARWYNPALYPAFYPWQPSTA